MNKLQTEIAAFEKQKSEELERLEQFREEELRKLRYVLMMFFFVKRYHFRYVIQIVNSRARPNLLSSRMRPLFIKNHLTPRMPQNEMSNFFCSRERRVFEKYQKAARSMPDKKERDEIESLRGQVNIV